MFRSEDVSCYQLIFSKEQAKQIMSEFGFMSSVEFDDLRSSEMDSQKPFFNQIQEINEQLKKLFVIKEYVKKNIAHYTEQEISQKTLKLVMDNFKIIQRKNEDQIYLEEKLKNLEQCFEFIEQQQKDMSLLQDKLIQSGDYINVLLYFQALLQDQITPLIAQDFNNQNSTIKSHFGVIPTIDFVNFQKQIFRVFWGNVILRSQSISTQHYHNINCILPQKTAFFLTFIKSESETMENKILKLIQGNNAQIFQIDTSNQNIESLININLRNNSEFSTLFERKQKDSVNQLEKYVNRNNVYQLSQIEIFEILLWKQMALYQNMNKLTQTENYFEGRIWIPSKKEEILKNEINQLVTHQEFSGFKIIKIKYNTELVKPPTYFELNTFTRPFQSIVNTYSIPKYKEVNPGVFTIVTFPFLFGVMFGDVGHGLCVFIFAMFLIFKKDSFPKFLQELRYLLALMGFFSTYCGLVYNDFFSLGLPLFKTCYTFDKDHNPIQNCVYPLGMDYSWLNSSNKIAFTNSFKMKLSIIIGVFHMIVGICNKGINSIYFKDYWTFAFEFLPQLLFMSSTFGYMCLLIICKWLTNYKGWEHTAPSIVSLFINFTGKIEHPIIGAGKTQEHIQKILFYICIVCVPIMLLFKPLIHHFVDKKRKNSYKKMSETHDHSQLWVLQNFEETLDAENYFEIVKHEEEAFSEILIHQMIETIEFLLGSISNTASYLRLWALSLAHTQLSEVFFDMLLKKYLKGEGNVLMNAIGLTFYFVIFAQVTIFVILLMDLMECFLHALRLHWVEFQNKFYKGDGRDFLVFSFQEEIARAMEK